MVIVIVIVAVIVIVGVSVSVIVVVIVVVTVIVIAMLLLLLLWCWCWCYRYCRAGGSSNRSSSHVSCIHQSKAACIGFRWTHIMSFFCGCAFFRYWLSLPIMGGKVGHV